MAANRIELWGRLVGEPELRITPAGTSVLRILVDCTERYDELALPVVMTGEHTAEVKPQLRKGASVRVEGSLKPVRRRLPSGITETALEVMARSITVEE